MPPLLREWHLVSDTTLCSDENLDQIDIVLVSCDENHRLKNDKIVIDRVKDLSNYRSKVKVFQCANLAVDYPPPHPELLRQILDMRSADKTNYLLLSYDKESLLAEAEIFHASFRNVPKRYHSGRLLDALEEIV